MSHPSKVKGNKFERDCVNKAKEKGLNAKRAYASNGESIGLEADVDMLLDDSVKVQCKIRKKIASWIKPPDSCDITLVREDRGEAFAIIRYEDYLNMLKTAKKG